jgi:hypothetical protein
MTSRPLNDDEVLSEMNKMVRIVSTVLGEDVAADCRFTSDFLLGIYLYTTGCFHQTGGP